MVFRTPTIRRVVSIAAVSAVVMTAPVWAQQAAPVTPAPAPADPQQVREELERLRQEFEAIRDSYGARLAALEAKLGGAPAADAPAASAGAAPSPGAAASPGAPSTQEPGAAASPAGAPATPATGAAPTPAPGAVAEAPAPPPPPQGGGTVDVPSGAAGAGGPQGTLPVYGNSSALSKIFNPDMAVIGNFVGSAGKNPVESMPSLQLQEAEVSLQAIVDPYGRADFFLAASPEGLEIEEGFLTLTSLPGGLLAKVGKMKEQFGKVNTLHAHTLPWVDEPLVMTNLLGGAGRSRGFGGLGFEAAPQSVVLPRSHGGDLPGQLRRRVRHQWSKGGQLARTAPRLP